MPVENGEWPEPLAQSKPVGRETETIHTNGPSSSSESEDLGLEPHRDGDEDEISQQDEEVEDEELPEFDPRWRDDFNGLLYLGRLTEKVSYLGHEFEIRTMTTDEVLEIGLLARPYQDTMGGVKAYQAAVVAACVVRLDGKPMPTPVTLDALDTPLRNRFDYVKKSWFPPILDFIYEQYLLLENRARQVLDAMGKASR